MVFITIPTGLSLLCENELRQIDKYFMSGICCSYMYLKNWFAYIIIIGLRLCC